MVMVENIIYIVGGSSSLSESLFCSQSTIVLYAISLSNRTCIEVYNLYYVLVTDEKFQFNTEQAIARPSSIYSFSPFSFAFRKGRYVHYAVPCARNSPFVFANRKCFLLFGGSFISILFYL
jgi:hypothetical protein